MKKTWISILAKIIAAALLLILLAALLLNLSTRVSVSKIERSGTVQSAYACVVIVSGSMEPAVSTGDLLLVKAEQSYSPGDVVTYVSESGSLITHRVQAVSTDGYVTQGDANNAPDETVQAQRILGKTVVVLSGLGAVIRWIFSPISVALLFCIVVLSWFIMHYAKESKRETKK